MSDNPMNLYDEYSKEFSCKWFRNSIQFKHHINDDWLYYGIIGRNPNVTLELMEENPNMFWCRVEFGMYNPNITWNDKKFNEYYEKYLKYVHIWNISILNITWEIICNYPEFSWDYSTISMNKNITWEIIYNNPNKFQNYGAISRNPNITWQIICDNPNLPWDYGRIASNPNFTMDMIKQIIINHPNSKTSVEWFFNDNPNVTWDIIKSNPDFAWKYDKLSIHRNITFEIICNNPDKPWDYGYLSANPNVTWEIICNHPKIPWDYAKMSKNPNISWKIVKENQDKNWNYWYLFANDMCGVKDMFIRKKMTEWFKRSDLKAELMANVWHPRNFDKFKYLDPETFGEDL